MLPVQGNAPPLASLLYVGSPLYLRDVVTRDLFTTLVVDGTRGWALHQSWSLEGCAQGHPVSPSLGLDESAASEQPCSRPARGRYGRK